MRKLQRRRWFWSRSSSNCSADNSRGARKVGGGHRNSRHGYPRDYCHGCQPATGRDDRQCGGCNTCQGCPETCLQVGKTAAKPCGQTTLAVAQVPNMPSSPNIPRNLGLDFYSGSSWGLASPYCASCSIQKVRASRRFGLSRTARILGVVAFDQKVPRHPVILRDEPLAAPSEAVRRLRTNLQFIDVANRPQSIVITSSIPGQGKSTMAINLAVSLSDTGARVILLTPTCVDHRSLITRHRRQRRSDNVLIGRADVKTCPAVGHHNARSAPGGTDSAESERAAWFPGHDRPTGSADRVVRHSAA
jgi:hypothetical protein